MRSRDEGPCSSHVCVHQFAQMCFCSSCSSGFLTASAVLKQTCCHLYWAQAGVQKQTNTAHQDCATIWTKADWRSHDTCKYTPCVVLCKADHRGRLWHVHDITPNRCFTHYNNVWFLLCPTHPHTEWGNNSEEEAELEQHFLCWLCTL